MKTVVKDLFRKQDEFGEKEITVSGWIRNIRISKNFGFIELNDGTFFKNLQIVIESDKLDNFAELSKLNIAAAITATGTLVLTPDAKQPFELKAENVVIDGESTPDYPLQKKRHSFEYLRTVAHLRPRTNTFSAVFRVRSMIAYAIHQFFQERGFVYVHTPIITASDCEGAGEMFQVTTLDLNNVPKNDDGTVDYSQDFFGKQANLTVSGQHLYKYSGVIWLILSTVPAISFLTGCSLYRQFKKLKNNFQLPLSSYILISCPIIPCSFCTLSSVKYGL